MVARAALKCFENASFNTVYDANGRSLILSENLAIEEELRIENENEFQIIELL